MTLAIKEKAGKETELSMQHLSTEDRRILKKLAPALFFNVNNDRMLLPDSILLAGAGKLEIRSLDRSGISEPDLISAGQMFRTIVMSEKKVPMHERENLLVATEKTKPIPAYFALLAFNLRDKMEVGNKMKVLDAFLLYPLTLSDAMPFKLRE
jgi:hypothetical protein